MVNSKNHSNVRYLKNMFPINISLQNQPKTRVTRVIFAAGMGAAAIDATQPTGRRPGAQPDHHTAA